VLGIKLLKITSFSLRQSRKERFARTQKVTSNGNSIICKFVCQDVFSFYHKKFCPIHELGLQVGKQVFRAKEVENVVICGALHDNDHVRGGYVLCRIVKIEVIEHGIATVVV